MFNDVVIAFAKMITTRIVAFFFLLLLAYKHQNKGLIFIKQFYPLLLTTYFYGETAFFNSLLFKSFDSKLYQIDQFIFGFQPSLEFSRLLTQSWFSELMYFGYFSYYFIVF